MKSSDRSAREYDDNSGYDVKTVLGEVKESPFKAEYLISAALTICGDTSGTRMQITDKHVKFKPSSFEDVSTLYLDTFLTIFDFNANTEVITDYEQYLLNNLPPGTAVIDLEF